MIEFFKYQGCGNDFALIDCMKSTPKLSIEEIVKMCDRNFGIGADGIIYLLPGKNGSDVTMRIFNSDGTEPEMCGNGIRCLAKHAYDFGVVKNKVFKISTGRGILVADCTCNNENKVISVKIDMGAPILDGSNVPVNRNGEKILNEEISVCGTKLKFNAVSMGNPHCIIFDDLSQEQIEKIGPVLEGCTKLFPKKVNVEFAKYKNGKIDVKVYERGVGWTLACGTGACATAVASALNGLTSFDVPVEVNLPGGTLKITVTKQLDHVYMDGPAEFVFKGMI